MKKSAVVLLLLCLGAAMTVHAQVTESATARTFAITAGGMVSGFNPNDGTQPYGSGTDHLIGLGTYVDMRFTHWIQVEGEGRWLRFYEYAGEHQDTYLVGPKVPIHQFGRANLYGKAMIGVGKMTFPNNYGYGTFTALAFGGGVDYRLSRKVTLRAVDFEYQDWPKFLSNTALYPYGVSVGMAYRVF
jgi:opacity protein-like surface antigen